MVYSTTGAALIAEIGARTLRSSVPTQPAHRRTSSVNLATFGLVFLALPSSSDPSEPRVAADLRFLAAGFFLACVGAA